MKQVSKDRTLFCGKRKHPTARGKGVAGAGSWPHLTSLMTSLAIPPQLCRYPSEHRSSSGMDRLFTICSQAWGLGFRTSLVSISVQAIAANASRVWRRRWGDREQTRLSSAPCGCSKS